MNQSILDHCCSNVCHANTTSVSLYKFKAYYVTFNNLKGERRSVPTYIPVVSGDQLLSAAKK